MSKKKKDHQSFVGFERLLEEAEKTSQSMRIHQQQLNPIAAYEAVRKFEQYFAGYIHATKNTLMRSHIALGAFKMHERNLEHDVHTEHCCVIHGCKYGSDKCPVELQEKWQSYPCEDCTETP